LIHRSRRDNALRRTAETSSSTVKGEGGQSLFWRGTERCQAIRGADGPPRHSSKSQRGWPSTVRGPGDRSGAHLDPCFERGRPGGRPAAAWGRHGKGATAFLFVRGRKITPVCWTGIGLRRSAKGRVRGFHACRRGWARGVRPHRCRRAAVPFTNSQGGGTFSVEAGARSATGGELDRLPHLRNGREFSGGQRGRSFLAAFALDLSRRKVVDTEGDQPAWAGAPDFLQACRRETLDDLGPMALAPPRRQKTWESSIGDFGRAFAPLCAA